MKKNLNIAHIHRSSEQGFAIPVAVGLGLIMILLGSMMIVRSQGDQVTASAQKATADSLAVVETGVTRVQSLLVKYPTLATTTLPSTASTAWQTEFARVYPTPTPCDLPPNSDTTVLALTDGTWSDVDSSDPRKGEFKISSYTYGTSKGELKIEGRARSEDSATTTSIDNSVTSLKVDIPVRGSSVSGIWVKSASSPPPLNLSTDDSIQANVVVVGCTYNPTDPTYNPTNTPTNKFRSFPNSARPTVTANPIAFPPLPDLPTTGPASGLGTVPPTGQYFLPSLNIPPGCYIVLPRIPRGGAGVTPSNARAANPPIKTGFGRESLDPAARSCAATNAPSGHGNSSAGVSPGANQSLANTFDITTDLPGDDGVYRYLIDTTSNPTGDSLNLVDSHLVIDAPTGQKVVLYLRGNMTLTGGVTGTTTVTCTPTSALVHVYANGGSPENLEIYGADGTKYGGAFKTTNIAINDKAAIHGFIYAPDAEVNVSQSQIQGAVWANNIVTNNSSGCGIGVAQDNVGNLSVTGGGQKIQPVQSWQREEAQ